MKSINKLFLAVALFLTAALPAVAQDTATQSAGVSFHSVLIGMIIVLSIVMLLVVYTLQQVVTVLRKETFGEKYTYDDESLTTWEKLLSLKPLAAEKDIDLGHDYDGIRELNNPIPPWFNVLFYGTIIFAAAYLFIYHVWDTAPLQAAEYKNEVVAAEKMKDDYLKKMGNAIDENTVQLITDKGALASAEQEYKTRCAACHGQKGEGGVGPNLTDEYWIHGGDIQSIFKTIKYGVPAKGMVAWQNAINPIKMQDLASFILSLQGTNPEGGKEPQGEKSATAQAAPTDSLQTN